MQTSIIQFEEYELDLASYELRRSGRAVHLEKIPMELLILLSEKAGQLVTREEIIRRLWGDDVFVDVRQGINTAVRKIRLALHDDPEKPGILQTVVGKGYRLASPVTIVAQRPSRDRIAIPKLPVRRRGRTQALGLFALLLAILVAAVLFRWRGSVSPTPVDPQAKWLQVTHFADSAVSPSLSGDGHILAFVRGDDTFLGAGEIYAKLMPHGEPVRLTQDGLMKMSPQFSPDGSRIAYTVGPNTWDTWVTPVMGGQPTVMLPNAAGLTWIDDRNVLFSEVKTGVHMGLTTASESRTESRDIYLPPRERGMVHRSAISPDHKWVLLAEMDNGQWLPCRLVPADGTSTGRLVGPTEGACTNVAWSPDGSWMFLNSNVDGHFHIWRQRFSDGQLKQVTSGVADEEGIAVAPDGRSLITSVGMTENMIWLHNAAGDRQLLTESHVEGARFSSDGRKLYYLVRSNVLPARFISGELHVTDLESGHNERLLPGIPLTHYDISPDGQRIVFSVVSSQGHSQLWLAQLNLLSSPRQFSSSVDEDSPLFDSNGYIYFRAVVGKSNFLYRMREDGSERVQVFSDAILGLEAVSRDRQWVVVFREVPGNPISFGMVAIPLGSGAPVTICQGFCGAGWTSDGKLFAIFSEIGEGKTLLMPVSPGRSLPALPPAGIQTHAEMDAIKGAKVINGSVAAVSTADLYVSFRRSVHRNLYRIPIQ
jgi:eukaryotic-like serine/threonine-protein kinase